MTLHYAAIIENPNLLRRRMVLNIEVDMFLQILRGLDGERRIQCKGIPVDAKCVGIVGDRLWNTVQLMLESAEFEEVPPEQTAPDLMPKFTLWAGGASPSHPNGTTPQWQQTNGISPIVWQNA